MHICEQSISGISYGTPTSGSETVKQDLPQYCCNTHIHTKQHSSNNKEDVLHMLLSSDQLFHSIVDYVGCDLHAGRWA